MQENQNPPSDTSRTPAVDHGIVVEQAAAATFKARCLCGWASQAVDGRRTAREHGLEHLVLKTATTREILDELTRRQDMQDAVADLSDEDQAEVRRAAAAAVGEHFVRWAPPGGAR